MTANERIEKLLNRFGQTISDLPRSKDEFNSTYSFAQLFMARCEALKFANSIQKLDYTTDYICHLADVIDRMEAALETALMTIDCMYCTAHCPDCGLDCETNAKICDGQLSGMYRYDFDEFVEGLNDCEQEI